jgi:hypothetical protein
LRAPFDVLAIVVCALAVCGWAVWGGDTAILVPPPEAVAEGFVRQVVAGRYEGARALLSAEAAAEVDRDRLEQLRRNLEAGAGVVVGVTARPDGVDQDHARATALVDGRDGLVPVWLSMSLHRGLWKIDAIKE